MDRVGPPRVYGGRRDGTTTIAPKDSLWGVPRREVSLIREDFNVNNTTAVLNDCVSMEIGVEDNRDVVLRVVLKFL